MPTFNYEAAKNAGYTDEEIHTFLSQRQGDSKKTSMPSSNREGRKFNTQAALDAGYTPEEINQFLSKKPQKTPLEKAGRIASQYGIAAAENAILPYELAVAPLASSDAQTAQYREGLGEDIERLLEQKASGVWDEQDESLLNDLKKQMQSPSESKKYIQTADLGLRNLAEKATGLDLQPEGVLENAANWAGYLKNPKNAANIFKEGVNPKTVLKAAIPGGKDAFVGLGASSAMEIARDGGFGPIGQLAAAVAGDVAARGLTGIGKGINKIIRNPKQAIAEAAAAFSPKNQRELQKEIIQDFRKAGLQADLGTITNSDLIKMVQTKLSQSGLTGEPLSKLRDQITSQIKNEYKNLAENLGEARFSTNHESGVVTQEAIKSIRDKDLEGIRNLYRESRESLKPDAFVNTEKLAREVKKMEKSLTPGQVKSGEQKKVLDVLEDLKRDIFDSEGNLIYGRVQDLMNNKIALNDIINYEVQGGAKQLLKGIVAELDRAIISHGKENPSFAKRYIQANKGFSEHAKTFRNKSVDQFLRAHDPAQILSKMGKIQGIRDVKKVLDKSSEGKKLFNDLKRLKLDQIVGDNLIDSTTKQVKFGTFSKMLEKGNRAEIVKELLGAQDFSKLQKLQKNSGKLADSMNKFLNSSQTAVSAADAAVIYQGMNGIGHLLSGNPWPIMKLTGGYVGAKGLSKLLGDTEFLKIVEDLILHSGKPEGKKFASDIQKLVPYFMQATQEKKESASMNMMQ